MGEEERDTRPDYDIQSCHSIGDCLDYAQWFAEKNAAQIIVPSSIAMNPGVRKHELKQAAVMFDQVMVPSLSAVMQSVIEDTNIPLSVLMSGKAYQDLVGSFRQEATRHISGIHPDLDSAALRQVYTDYTQFALNPFDKFMSKVVADYQSAQFRSDLTQERELIAYANQLSEEFFHDPSGCAGLPSHRKFAVAFYTALSSAIVVNASSMRNDRYGLVGLKQRLSQAVSSLRNSTPSSQD